MTEEADFFTQDRYLFEPYEDAMFFYEHSTGKIRMKFVGQDYATPIPHDHRIYNDAIRTRQEITQAEYEAGRVAAR